MAFLYRHRNVPAGAAACAVVAVAIWSQTHRTLPVRRDNALEPVTLTLVELPTPVPPLPPAPTPPSPTPPRTTAPTVPAVPTPPRPVESRPAPTPTPDPLPGPRAEAPPLPTAPAPATPPPPTPSPPAPAPSAPPPVAAVDPSATYTGRVRAYLNSIKRYPTGREASLSHPEGKVRIWFVVRRDGSLVDAGVEDSSNSILLDNAGLTTVRRGSLPAFEGAFGTEEQHRFTVDLDFKSAT